MHIVFSTFLVFGNVVIRRLFCVYVTSQTVMMFGNVILTSIDFHDFFFFVSFD